jgi:hypothetical protein
MDAIGEHRRHRRDWPEALRRREATGEKFRNIEIDLDIAWTPENLGRIGKAETGCENCSAAGG